MATGYPPEFESYFSKLEKYMDLKLVRSTGQSKGKVRATVIIFHNSFVAAWYLPLTTDSATEPVDPSESTVTESEQVL
uniref:Uncharacterized protein n=1 Tax=Panagrellus redivivus TaxID=6233 RepID=A0A7E4ZXZ4_PANRE